MAATLAAASASESVLGSSYEDDSALETEFGDSDAVEEDAPELAVPGNLPQTTGPLMELAAVSQQLGPKVLAALDAKFNGSLTQVRHLDENDLLF